MPAARPIPSSSATAHNPMTSRRLDADQRARRTTAARVLARGRIAGGETSIPAAGIAPSDEVGRLAALGHDLIRASAEHDGFDLRQLVPRRDDEEHRVPADAFVFRD